MRSNVSKKFIKTSGYLLGATLGIYYVTRHNEENLLSSSTIDNQQALSDESKFQRCKLLIKRYQIEHGIPGVVVAVSKNSKVIFSKGFGYSDVENGVKASTQTQMRIASISKPLTSLIAAKLIENGKLDIDLPIENYAKDLPDFKTIDGIIHKISTRQLMSHTSGVRHYKENKNVEGEQKKSGSGDAIYDEFYLNKNFKTTREALEIFLNDNLVHSPGSKFFYTTHGYTLLSYVIEHVCNLNNNVKEDAVKFSTLLEDLFKLINLRNTYLDQNEPIIPNRSKYYMRNKKKRLVNVPAVDLSNKWAGGGVMSNVTDLIKFGNLMLECYQTGDDDENGRVKFIKSSTIRNYLWSPQAFDEIKTKKLLEDLTNKKNKIFYGLGWFLCIDSSNDKLNYAYHTGGAVGASSCLLILPNKDKVQGDEQLKSDGIVVAVLCNTQDLSEISKFTLDIAKIFANEDQ